MKTLRHIAIALFVFVLATAATADARRMSPQTASNRSSRVTVLKSSLEAEGYALKHVQEQPIYYFVAPKAPYLWGSMVYTFSRTADNGGTDEIELTVAIQYTEAGYAFPEITLRERLSE